MVAHSRVPAAERPSVLMIAIDDLNDWVGCLDGHPQAFTPNIDRLARRGVLFSNAHCAAPACNPSRAILFSGKMPWQTGVWSNDSKRLFQQHPNIEVIPRTFRNAGYATLGTGKLMHSSGSANRLMFEQHFNPEQRWSPFDRKLLRYTPAEQPSKGTEHPRHVFRMPDQTQIILPLNGMPSDRKPETSDPESFDWGPLDVPDSEMGDTQITDWAIERIRAGFKGQPFFVGVGYYRPHIPLFAPKRYFERFEDIQVQLPPVIKDDLQDLSDVGQRWAVEAVTAGSHSTVVRFGQWQEAVKAYLACTTFVDHQIGRLVKALDESEFGDNTIVVLWSDHGWHLGEKQHWGKWTGWERSTRVPLIMVPPMQRREEFAEAGSRCESPVSLIDIYPTLTDLCGIKPVSQLDGESLMPMLKKPGRRSNRKVISVFDVGNISIRSARYRYIRYADGSEELYDLGRDPNEWMNLAAGSEPASELAEFRKLIPAEALTHQDQ